MALVSDIQLQNRSVTPPKLDDTAEFTAASFTATTGFYASENISELGSLSGFLTLKSANNVDAYLQTTKVDGDAGFYLNNDSDVFWNIKVSGTSDDSYVIETVSGDQVGRLTHFAIKPAGHIGFGTIDPSNTVVGDFYGNDPLSAAVNITNAKENIITRISSEATSGNIGTITNSKFGIRQNSQDVIVINTTGQVGFGVAAPGYAVDVLGDINFSGVIRQGGVAFSSSQWTGVASDVYRASDVGIGFSAIKIQEWQPGSYLTVSNTSTRGQVEIDGIVADADGARLGSINFTYSTNSDTYRVLGVVEAVSEGTTVNQRGGALKFHTKTDGTTTAAGLVERMIINKDGHVGINIAAPTYHLEVGGDINITGDIRQNGVVYSASNWTVDGSDVYRDSDVGIGSNLIAGQVWRAGSYLTLSNATTRGQLRINATVADADAANLGGMTFEYSSNATTHKVLGVIEVDSEGGTSTQRGGKLKFFTKQNAVAQPALNMVINEAGNVGIGESAPTDKLAISYAGVADVTLKNSLNSTTLKLSADAAKVTMGSVTNHPVEILVNDALVGTVSTGGIDLPNGKQFTINNVPIGSGAAALTAFSIDWPQEVSALYDDYKVSIIDLQATNFTWDWEFAKREIRNKSWYNELNAPPTHGMLIVDASQNALQWVNRSYDTDGVSYFTSYMTFTVGANNMLPTNINDVVFKDFKLYVAAAGGVYIIDFMEDTAYAYTNNGYYIYAGNINERNAASGYLLLNSGGNDYLQTAIRSDISILRDGEGNTDIYTRPLHIWSAASDGTQIDLELYIPSSTGRGSLYNYKVATENNLSSHISQDGNIYQLYDPAAGNDTFAVLDETVYTITGNVTTNEIESSAWGSYTDPAGTSFIGGSVNSIDNKNAVLVGSSQGVSMFYHTSTDTLGTLGLINFNSTYVTPYMKGAGAGNGIVVAYPLNDLNDRGGNGDNLTNVGTTLFTGTSPLGISCPNFDGIDDYLHSSTLYDTGTEWTYSLYFKSSSSTNPASAETLLNVANSWSPVANEFHLTLNTSGTLTFDVDATGTANTVTSSSDLYDNKWHHAVLTDDGTNVKAYIDGVQFSSTPSTQSGVNTLVMSIGALGTAAEFFDGEIANVFVGRKAWSLAEVEFENDRMLAGLAGYSALVTSDTIDAISVDQNSGYGIIAAGNAAHIINARNGLIYNVDAISSGTLNDVDVISLFESPTPHYILGGSLNIEQVAANTSVLNGGVPAAPTASARRVILDEGTPFTDRPNMNFVGPAVSVSDDAGNDRTVITVTAEGAVIPFWDSTDTQDDIELLSAVISDYKFGMSTTTPLKIEVSPGVTWTLGWWQSADNRWWLLGNTADVGTFARADAEFYIPTGDIADVPSS